MKRRILIPIILIFFVAVSSTFFLALDANKVVNKKNGFNRVFLYDVLTPIKSIKLSRPSIRIAGFTDRSIFLYSSAFNNLTILDFKLNILDSIVVPIAVDTKYPPPFDMFVDSPMIRIFSRNFGTIYSHNLGDTAYSEITLDVPLFTKVAPLNNESFVLRAFDSSRSNQFFAKGSYSKGTTTSHTGIVESKRDAGFSTDGILQYDRLSNKLFYFQYYTNKFYCLDTNLNILYTNKTIDTTNTNLVEIRNTSKDNGKGSLLPSSPLRVVNRSYATHNKYILVLSNLRADNEDISQFKNNSAVDLYLISNGDYIGSLYIPNVNAQKPKRFYIHNEMLLCILDDGISMFKIQLPN